MYLNRITSYFLELFIYFLELVTSYIISENTNQFGVS